MKRFDNKIKKILNNKITSKFGGHPSKLVDTEYNPDNLKVHENDITPEQVEKHRDIYYENRPQDIKYSQTAKYMQSFLDSRIARNRFFVGLLKNIVQSQSIKEQRNSTYINPPKIHDNSVFICQAQELGQLKQQLRQCDILLVGGALLVSVSPLYHILFGALIYGTWANAFQYYPSKCLVLRMDLLPHLEQVSVLRIGFNGRIYNKLYNINSIQKIDYDDLAQQKNMFARTLSRNFDLNMIFRDSETGDYLMFDNQSVWDKKGLEHEIISSRNQ